MLRRQGLNYQYSIFNWISTVIGKRAFLGSNPGLMRRANKLAQTSFIPTGS